MSLVDTRPVPVTLLRWPRTRDLITQHKAILLYLWPNPCQTACGCYLLPVEATAADLSMTSASLVDALGEFERRGLIDLDHASGEVFICDWFRFYKPATPKARWAVEAAIEKIISPRLRKKVEKSYKSTLEGTKEKEKEKEKEAAAAAAACARTRVRAREAPAGGGGAAAAIPQLLISTPSPGGGQLGKRRWRRESGIVSWDAFDISASEKIERQHDANDIMLAVESLEKQGLEPVPGRVLMELEKLAKARQAAQRHEFVMTAASEPAFDTQAKARGNAILSKIRARRTKGELNHEKSL